MKLDKQATESLLAALEEIAREAKTLPPSASSAAIIKLAEQQAAKVASASPRRQLKGKAAAWAEKLGWPIGQRLQLSGKASPGARRAYGKSLATYRGARSDGYIIVWVDGRSGEVRHPQKFWEPAARA